MNLATLCPTFRGGGSGVGERPLLTHSERRSEPPIVSPARPHSVWREPRQGEVCGKNPVRVAPAPSDGLARTHADSVSDGFVTC